MAATTATIGLDLHVEIQLINMTEAPSTIDYDARTATVDSHFHKHANHPTSLIFTDLERNIEKILVIIVPSVKFDASTHCLEWWCERAHHITIRSVRQYSMKGGVRVDITSQ